MQKIQSAPDRRWAKDVAPGDEIKALYLIASASQLQAKNGPFWRLELKDAPGILRPGYGAPSASSSRRSLPASSPKWKAAPKASATSCR